MIWLQYITLIGIVSIAHGDLMCFHKTILACNLSPDNICGSEYNMAKCVSNIAKTCGLENDQDIIDLQSFSQEMCREGSELNKKYKQSKGCTPKLNTYCTAGFNKAVQETVKRVEPSALFEEIYKVSCRYRKEIASCTEENIKEKCGSRALSWHKEQKNLGNRLQDRLCVQLNGSGIKFTSLSMWLLEAAILVFVIKWLSC